LAMKPDVLLASLCGLLTEIYIFHLDWSTVIFQEGVLGREVGRKANCTYLTNLTTSPGSPPNMRRFTRLTNAFSKKVENLGYALALHFMYYNFCRIHQTMRMTPAMKAKVTDRLWEIEDILALIN